MTTAERCGPPIVPAHGQSSLQHSEDTGQWPTMPNFFAAKPALSLHLAV